MSWKTQTPRRVITDHPQRRRRRLAPILGRSLWTRPCSTSEHLKPVRRGRGLAFTLPSRVLLGFRSFVPDIESSMPLFREAYHPHFFPMLAHPPPHSLPIPLLPTHFFLSFVGLVLCDLLPPHTPFPCPHHARFPWSVSIPVLRSDFRAASTVGLTQVL